MGCRASRNDTPWSAQVSDLPENDEPLSPDVDPNSAAAKIAIRRASKGYSQTTERTVIFELANVGEKRQVSEALDGVGEVDEGDEVEQDDSMSARILARKASKNKINLARRLTAGTEEVEWGETPIGVQHMGVKLSPHCAELQRQRSSSKAERIGSKGPGRQVSSNSNAGGSQRQVSAGSLSPSSKVRKTVSVEDVVAGDASPSSGRVRTGSEVTVQTSTIEEENEEDTADDTQKDPGTDLRTAAVAPISEDAAIGNPFQPTENIP